MKNYVFCLGGAENTLGLARYMSRSGFKTVYFDDHHTIASFCKYLEFHKLSEMSDADLVRLILALEKDLRGNRQPIFFNSDRFVCFANKQRKNLEEKFAFLIPDSRVIECALDKSRMGEIFPSELLPNAFALQTYEDLLSVKQRIVVKPRDTSGPIPFKMKLLNSASDLAEFGNRYNAQLSDFLFQEVVGGPKTRLVSIFFYRSAGGQFYSVPIEKERMIPYWGGVGCLIRSSNCDSVEPIERALSQMGYVGLGEVDLCESQGRITVFDLNVRLPSWAFFAEKCGIDMVGLYSRDVTSGLCGRKIVSSAVNCRNAKAIDLVNDIITVFHPKEGLLVNRVLTPWQYLKSLHGVRYFYVLRFNDFAPFLYKLKITLQHTFLRIRSLILG